MTDVIVLMVPIHLDALYLAYDQAVLEGMADFSRLPYFDGQQDINPDVANISEEILTQPFQAKNLFLKAGIHLHWALPDALHRGVHTQSINSSPAPNLRDSSAKTSSPVSTPRKLNFMPAPNRWLVSRTDQRGTHQWVVESNYLHLPSNNDTPSAITYAPDQPGPLRQSVRFLGRKISKENWNETDPQGNNPAYLQDLTAFGYGEPTFAAFYPNCHSVFGFHDSEVASLTISDLKGVVYDVIGWYSDPSKDCLTTKIFHEAVEATKTKHQQRDILPQLQFEALREAFGWTLASVDQTIFPQQTIYYASLTISAETFDDPLPPSVTASIAIGNTITEALSAHLADTLDGDKTILEDQLEALDLMPELEGQQTDTGAKFREARHEKGFKAVSGGQIWTLRPTATTPGSAQAHETPVQTQVTLPDELAHLLNQLNLLQQAYERAGAELETLRQQLFADWYKYMVSAYPPDDSRDDFPDMDEIRFFIENQTLPTVRQKQAEFDDLRTGLQQAIARVKATLPHIQRLWLADIRNWDRFISQLSQKSAPVEPALTPAVTKMWQALSAKQQSQLTATPPTNLAVAEKVALLDDINDHILAVDFFQEADLPLDRLPNEAQRLWQKRPQWLAAQTLRFNRLVWETCFPQAIVRRPEYELNPIPGPRYWQPNNPVVLIAHPTIKPTPRHGADGRLRADGLLDCLSLTITDFTGQISDHLERLRAGIASAKPADDEEKIGFTQWTEQPWHPFLLEWRVEVFPVQEKGNLNPQTGAYDPDFLTANYQFPEDAVDLVLRDPQTTLTRASNIYSGRSILTDYANLQLIKRLETYLDKQDQNSTDAFTQALRAIHNHLQQSQVQPLAQSLAGFNEALLQHKQTLQLPIADPLGFADTQAFTNQVHTAVQRSNIRAPQPLNDFNPIRSGAMRLIALRLVDTFGRVQSLLTEGGSEQVVAATTLGKTPQSHIFLPPRLTQPTRLNFRWLSANHKDEMEMNTHPATSPICGWVVPNFLDNTLLVYEQTGRSLGTVLKKDTGIGWQPAPGDTFRFALANIQNPHLQRWVAYLLAQDQSFFDDFLTAVESGLENIEPDNSAQHEALALLMGRPLAVVRASLGLELQGLPAINQDWNIFRQDLRRDTRDTDNFTAVQIPIRLGEHFRLNDGLVGFWVEAESGYAGQKFYVPQSPDAAVTQSINHPNIILHRGTEQPHLLQALDTPPRTLTMLVDPRAAVHVTTGILPTKAIRIPPDQYVDALRRIEVTFLTAPIITSRQEIELSLPTEPGFKWSWLAKENGVWADTTDIKPAKDEATFAAPHMLREGWLKLSPDQGTGDESST